MVRINGGLPPPVVALCQRVEDAGQGECRTARDRKGGGERREGVVAPREGAVDRRTERHVDARLGRDRVAWWSRENEEGSGARGDVRCADALGHGRELFELGAVRIRQLAVCEDDRLGGFHGVQELDDRLDLLGWHGKQRLLRCDRCRGGNQEREDEERERGASHRRSPSLSSSISPISSAMSSRE